MSAQVVSFRCVLKTTQGQIISSTVNQNVLTDGGSKGLPLKPLLSALCDLRKGEKRSVCVRAAEAFGFYNPGLVIERPLEELLMSEPVAMGERVVYDRDDGSRGVFRVVAISPESITLDGNHPLAGLDLVFELEGMESRAATPDEVAESLDDVLGIETENVSHSLH